MYDFMNELISLKNMVTVLQTTLDNIGAYIYIKDLKGRYIFVNRLVKELFDTPLEEIIGFDDSKFFSLEISDDLRVNDRLVMEQGQTIEKEEKNHVIKTGEIKYYWTVKKPLRDENGTIAGMYGISTDITETKKLEHKVNQKNAELLRYLDIIHSDLNTAKSIQKNLLPKNLDQDEELDISVRYLPLSEVGGDIYDVHRLRNDTIRIFLADATGHGVQAALMTMSIHSEYLSIKDYILPPGRILTILNTRYFRRYSHLNSFFSCFVLDIDLKEGVISYSSAGHPDQILFHSDRQIRLKSTGKIIGVLENVEYETREEEFDPADRVCLFSDGVHEMINSDSKEFGEDKFFAIADELKTLPPSDFLDNIIRRVFAFLETAPQQDDITLISVQRKTH